MPPAWQQQGRLKMIGKRRTAEELRKAEKDKICISPLSSASQLSSAYFISLKKRTRLSGSFVQI
jgi:hypothetical protein